MGPGVKTDGAVDDIKGGGEVVCCVIVKPNKSSSEVGWLKSASYELVGVDG